MGTSRFIMFKKTNFDFFLGFMHGFLCRNMCPVVDSFWVFLSKLFAHVFGSIICYFFRFLEEKQSTDHVDEGDREAEDSSMVVNTSKYEFLSSINGITGFIEEPKTGSYTVHELYMDSNNTGNFNGRILDSGDSAYGDIGKIEVEDDDVVEEKAENSIESFRVEKVLEKEPKLMETNSVFENKTEESVLRFSFATGFEKQIKQEDEPEQRIETEGVVDKEEEDFVENFVVERLLEKPKQGIETENELEEKAEESVENSNFEKFLEKTKQGIETEDDFEEKEENSVENFNFEKFLEKPKQGIETENDFEEKAGDSVKNYIIEEGKDHVEDKFWDFFDGAVIDKYLEKREQEKEESNKDGEIFSPKNKIDVESTSQEVLDNGMDSTPESHLLVDGLRVENIEQEIISGPFNDSDDEFIELDLGSEDLSMEEAKVSIEKNREEEEEEEEEEDDDDDDDDSEFGSEDEDDDLIEQLKMEMKMARTGGLPTILEDSESPKVVQQLGPLQIDEKYDHKDHVIEIQKVYKSYSDKMKKLDILNSQTMHAIGLLQLKDTVRPSTSGKSSAPEMKSLLSHKVWLFKQRKLEDDPAMKLIRDLYKDFETVYVGQVCLSWEILHWQFGKVKKLLECDGQGLRQYNQVAGEFQHFQVIVQRFVEDEPFQARPRVENYVKNRRALRQLLQVPVIKDDCSKYKNGAGDEEVAVSSEMLTYIIEESMHVFWEFLRADKDEANVTSKTPQQAQVAPHDPIDLELLMDVRTDLQKVCFLN
ncbi:hypothetical protein PTKIN_Ptkin17bG0157000 [Pterospermum kingtungense]